MTPEEYLAYAKEQLPEIERTLSRMSDYEVRAFWQVNDLLSVWRELRGNVERCACYDYPQTLKERRAA